MIKIKIYFRLLRVNHYIKNLFIFAPLFFVFNFEEELIYKAVITFFLFSMLTSSVYIFNDLFDVEDDKKHPDKKFRPIASGVIAYKKALVIGFFLLFMGLAGSYLINKELFIVFLCYNILNIVYSALLKHIPVVDVILISSGFLLRILAGSYATGIPASNWIIVMTFLLSLFLAFSKRRSDLVFGLQNEFSPKNTTIYSLLSINFIVIALAIAICVCYIFYAFSAEVIHRFESSLVFITGIWVGLGIFRYIQLVFSNEKYSDPTSVIIKDLILKIIILCWLLSFIAIKYI